MGTGNFAGGLSVAAATSIINALDAGMSPQQAIAEQLQMLSSVPIVGDTIAPMIGALENRSSGTVDTTPDATQVQPVPRSNAFHTYDAYGQTGLIMT